MKTKLVQPEMCKKDPIKQPRRVRTMPQIMSNRYFRTNRVIFTNLVFKLNLNDRCELYRICFINCKSK